MIKINWREKIRDLARAILIQDKEKDLKGVKMMVFFKDGTYEEYNSRFDEKMDYRYRDNARGDGGR